MKYYHQTVHVVAIQYTSLQRSDILNYIFTQQLSIYRYIEIIKYVFLIFFLPLSYESIYHTAATVRLNKKLQNNSPDRQNVYSEPKFVTPQPILQMKL